uniref:Uncharacterized protein n=1 Tax=Oryza brachyantha TaxID=4533 RepID=J3MKI8_ORYBR
MRRLRSDGRDDDEATTAKERRPDDDRLHEKLGACILPAPICGFLLSTPLPHFQLHCHPKTPPPLPATPPRSTYNATLVVHHGARWHPLTVSASGIQTDVVATYVASASEPASNSAAFSLGAAGSRREEQTRPRLRSVAASTPDSAATDAALLGREDSD